MRLMSISKVLSVGDMVYSAANGQPLKVTKVYSVGFETEEDYFFYDEHRKLFWLHPKSFLHFLKRSEENAT